MQAAIEVRAIGQRTRFRGITLRDISLTVGYGELVAIVGGSGSGKTALLDVMSGLRPPSSGTVRREREQIGYVPDADTLHAVLPLGRALRYTASIRGVRLGERDVEDALRAAGLAARADFPVGQLDPGERKRAAIAAELLAGPAFLFLEEPTAALDPVQGAEVMRLLRRRCDEGTTVVFTTHSPLDAARCDKVALLAAGGHLAFFGTTQAACGYFGADSLEEICERLAGLGDPATAWSRRFFQFAQASSGFLVSPTIPARSGPANLMPDYAGPHSAGRPYAALLADDDWPDDGWPDGDLPDGDQGRQHLNGRSPHGGRFPQGGRFPDGRSLQDGRSPGGRSPDGRSPHGGQSPDGRSPQDGRSPDGRSPQDGQYPQDAQSARDARYAVDGTGPKFRLLPAPVDPRGVTVRALRPIRQLATLMARNADLLRRDRTALAVLAVAPLGVLLALAVLLPAGALGQRHESAASMAWTVLGVFAAGLAYGLPQLRRETGVVRAERFAGLNSAWYVLAKLAILMPAMAAGDALILLVPAFSQRLPADGYGTTFVLLLLSSVVALALVLLLSAAFTAAFSAVPAALAIPLVLLAAALLDTLVTLVQPAWAVLLVLATLAAALLVATSVLINRGTPKGLTGPVTAFRSTPSPPLPWVRSGAVGAETSKPSVQKGYFAI